MWDMIITFRYYNIIDVFIIGYSKGIKSISNISKSIQDSLNDRISIN